MAIRVLPCGSRARRRRRLSYRLAQPSGQGQQALCRRGVPAAEYLAGKEIVAVGADTWGLDAVPFENPKRVWEAHQVLLAKNGVYILETLNTKKLVEDKAWEFLFVLGQPLYTGAVQAIINPIAIR